MEANTLFLEKYTHGVRCKVSFAEGVTCRAHKDDPIIDQMQDIQSDLILFSKQLYQANYYMRDLHSKIASLPSNGIDYPSDVYVPNNSNNAPLKTAEEDKYDPSNPIPAMNNVVSNLNDNVYSDTTEFDYFYDAPIKDHLC